MPQLNKGGKYVFGLSVISDDGQIRFPAGALSQYPVAQEGRVILFTGSKITGGFCVTAKRLLLPSKLGHIPNDCPALFHYETEEGEFVPYKGRAYAWVSISPSGVIRLGAKAMALLHLSAGDKLMAIKSSDIAFTMGAKGPLMEKALAYPGSIPEYRV